MNDNPPIFDQDTYTATLVENTPAGTTVVTVNATDADIGTNAEVIYVLLSDPSLMNVHNVTGEVFLIAAPDFETNMTITTQVSMLQWINLPVIVLFDWKSWRWKHNGFIIIIISVIFLDCEDVVPNQKLNSNTLIKHWMYRRFRMEDIS